MVEVEHDAVPHVQQEQPRQRDRIVDATGRLFSDKGYHGTSMADIGRAVGLEKGSLYNHITAKQDVLRELVERGADLFIAGIEPVVVSTEPAAARVRAALRAHLRVVAGDPTLATVFLHEWRQLDGPARARVGVLRDGYERAWREIVASGVRDGSFRPDTDVRFAALALLSAANWAYQWFDPHGSLSGDEVAGRFADLALRGLLRSDDATPPSSVGTVDT